MLKVHNNNQNHALGIRKVGVLNGLDDIDFKDLESLDDLEDLEI